MTAQGNVQLIDVLPNQRFDEGALLGYLQTHLSDFEGPITVRQFVGGQSNPTYHLQTPSAAYVMRKKPSGKLLPSAHAVDREFAAMKALYGSGVPVPRVRLLCDDESVVGQMFYVMDHVDGRVFTDRLLADCTPDERGTMYDDMNRVLAALHEVDFRAVGLGNFGKAENYAERQITRWSRQYSESRVMELPDMDYLLKWLPDHIPASQEASIAHGDFRLGNLIYHPTESRVVAVLDWELATIGHPFADLAYNCLSYRLPHLGGRGFGEANLDVLGIPREEDYLARYCERTGRASIPDWEFYVVLSMFRTAAILVGVHRRALQGNAADARAVGSEIYRVIAEKAAAIARQIE
ncbi:phosphotransferase [Polaromonas sp. P1-6]|nr:phosphotransferase [Polaromonas sp. P1-6]